VVKKCQNLFSNVVCEQPITGKDLWTTSTHQYWYTCCISHTLKVAFCQKVQCGSKKCTKSLSWVEKLNKLLTVMGENSNFLLRIVIWFYFLSGIKLSNKKLPLVKSLTEPSWPRDYLKCLMYSNKLRLFFSFSKPQVTFCLLEYQAAKICQKCNIKWHGKDSGCTILKNCTSSPINNFFIKDPTRYS
jgi:hypothetical protein